MEYPPLRGAQLPKKADVVVEKKEYTFSAENTASIKS